MKSHHSELPDDPSVNGADVSSNVLFMMTLDPRPIKCTAQADRFMRKLKVDGFLVPNTTRDEREHLTRTLANWIAEAVRADRLDRILP